MSGFVNYLDMIASLCCVVIGLMVVYQLVRLAADLNSSVLVTRRLLDVIESEVELRRVEAFKDYRTAIGLEDDDGSQQEDGEES